MSRRCGSSRAPKPGTWCKPPTPGSPIKESGRATCCATQEREKLAYVAQSRWLIEFGTSLEEEFGINPFTLLVLKSLEPLREEVRSAAASVDVRPQAPTRLRRAL